MSLLQLCPEDEQLDLAQMETVGDARRKNYLSKAMARAKSREEQDR